MYTLCSPTKENKVRAMQVGVVRPLLELMADQELGMVDKAAYMLARGQTVAELVEAGATVLGPRPTKATGLRNYPDCDKMVEE